MKETSTNGTEMLGNLTKLRRLTKNATSLRFPYSPKKGGPSKSKKIEILSDTELLELLKSGNDETLKIHIQNHPLSEQMQRYLICSHRLKLIKLYIDLYGFCPTAQLEFLDFMEEHILL